MQRRDTTHTHTHSNANYCPHWVHAFVCAYSLMIFWYLFGQRIKLARYYTPMQCLNIRYINIRVHMLKMPPTKQKRARERTQKRAREERENETVLMVHFNHTLTIKRCIALFSLSHKFSAFHACFRNVSTQSVWQTDHTFVLNAAKLDGFFPLHGPIQPI